MKRLLPPIVRLENASSSHVAINPLSFLNFSDFKFYSFRITFHFLSMVHNSDYGIRRIKRLLQSK